MDGTGTCLSLVDVLARLASGLIIAGAGGAAVMLVSVGTGLSLGEVLAWLALGLIIAGVALPWVMLVSTRWPGHSRTGHRLHR